MRMIDDREKRPIRSVSLYLNVREARETLDGLSELLKDPEAYDHFHVYSDDSSREISCSVITKRKLVDLSRYNRIERKVLSED
jgi:hypothetical protein